MNGLVVGQRVTVEKPKGRVRSGRVESVFRGMATVRINSGQALVVPVGECEPCRT